MMKLPLLYLGLLLAGCSNKGDPGNAPVLHLDAMDSLDVGRLNPNNVSSMVFYQNHWFLSFENQPVIIKADSSFHEILRYSRQGHGPAELLDTRMVIPSTNYLWVTDFVGLAIHRFDFDLGYKDRIPLEFKPFGIYTINDSTAWLGNMDMEFSDIHEVSVQRGLARVRRVRSQKAGAPPESITLFEGHNGRGVIFHPFTNTVQLLRDSVVQVTFRNVTRPDRPTYKNALIGQLAEGKIHQSAFLTRESICLFSGEHHSNSHQAACFDADGQLIRRLEFRPQMNVGITRGDTLYTYSPHTHHVYRYLLDF